MSGGGIGIISSGKNNTLTQIGVRSVFLNVPDDAPFTGAAYGGLLASAEIRLRLFSGHAGSDRICGSTGDGSVTKGFIDIAGYTSGPISCGNITFKELDTTNQTQWRDAHRELCGSTVDPTQTSCHYPHEQLLGAVHGENDTLWLVSRQRYPYKTESNPNGLVRITGLNLTSVPAPTLNTAFAEQGIRLLSRNASAPPLPEGEPTAWSVSQDRLVALYPVANNTNVTLASFPLNDQDGDYYHQVNITDVIGTPIHLTREDANYTIWTREDNGTEDIVYRYQLEPEGFRGTNESEYNLTSTMGAGARVLGMGSANDLLYLVQRSGTDILLDRIDMQTGELFYRNILRNSASPDGSDPNLPEVPDPDKGLSYTVYPQGDGTVLILPRRSVLATVPPEQVQGLKVTLPDFGGQADWQTLGGQVLNITEPYQGRDPESTGDGGSNAGGIAAGVLVAGAGGLATATGFGVACSCKHSKLCKRCRKQVRQQWSPGKGKKNPMDSLKYPAQSQGDAL